MPNYMSRKGKNKRRSKKKMLLRQSLKTDKFSHLFTLFKIVFTRDTSENWESHINPELNRDSDYMIIARVLIALTDALQIDTKCHDKFCGNLTIEELTSIDSITGELEPPYDYNEIYGYTTRQSFVDCLNKFTNTSFDYYTYDSDSEDICEICEKFHGLNTTCYIQIINYHIIWIDRFAHKYVDNSLIPDSEKSNAIDSNGVTYYSINQNENREMIESNGTPYYEDENDICFRNDGHVFTRDDFDNIESIPEILKTAWELFKTHHTILLKKAW